MHEVTKKFRETVAHWSLWERGDSLLVGVSGGIDSMVLLDLLGRLPEKERPQLTVLHYNHRLRGEESDADQRFVQGHCAERQIPVVIGGAPPWNSKKNLQERARTLRYDFFVAQAKMVGISRVALAHQADDQAETFLIRWLQGAGLRGLAGIPLIRKEDFLTVIRPLLLVGRREIEDYAKRFEVSFREDSSNAKEDYLRNRIRKILGSLKEMNPNLPERTAVNALLIRADEEWLALETEKIKDFAEDFPLAVYRALPRALRYRTLQRIFEKKAGEGCLLRGEAILKLDQLLDNLTPVQSYNLPHGIRFEKDYVVFRLI